MRNNDEKIEASLNSLDGIRRAGPGPFFYTRVSARLEKGPATAWERISGLITRPVVAVSGLCLVIVVNMLVVMTHSSEITTTSDASEVAVAEAYTLATTSFYDYENQEAR